MSSSAPLLQQQQQQQPHALLCSLPAQGHVAPFLGLATLLACNGIAVTYVSAHHCIAPLPAAHPSLLADPLIRLVGLPERVPLPLRSAGLDDVNEDVVWLFDVGDSMKDDFVELVKLQDDAAAAADGFAAPDCIIGDPCLSWITQGLLPLRSSEEPRLMSFPGLPALWDTDIFSSMRDVLPAGMRRAILNCGLVVSQSSRILLNTAYEVEAAYIDALQKEDPYKTNFSIQTIGPLLPLELLDKDHAQYPLRSKHESSVVRECIEWLNTQSPASVLYVSFGSLYFTSHNEITEIAHGLEASNHAFLWVLRPPPSDNSQNAGTWLSRVLPQGFQARTQHRGLILPHWAPQRPILSNPAIGCFLTHCGWNSILESICCGVPLIAYPQFAEQRLNCRMVVDELRIGMELEKDKFKGFSENKAVERAVRSVMEGEEGHEFRREVAGVREKVRMAVKENGSSYRNRESIVHEIFNYFHQKLDKENKDCLLEEQVNNLQA